MSSSILPQLQRPWLPPDREEATRKRKFAFLLTAVRFGFRDVSIERLKRAGRSSLRQGAAGHPQPAMWSVVWNLVTASCAAPRRSIDLRAGWRAPFHPQLQQFEIILSCARYEGMNNLCNPLNKCSASMMRMWADYTADHCTTSNITSLRPCRSIRDLPRR